MFTRNDLIDLIVRNLSAPSPAASQGNGEASYKGRKIPSMLPKGRVFLSEYDIKKRLTAQAQHLTIPAGAILSPLAVDWLVLKGIRVVQE